MTTTAIGDAIARVNAELAQHPTIAKALTHPTRGQILTILAEHDELSPSELADRIDKPIGNVSYHVRTLAALGLITQTRTEPRRGAVEHYYRLA